MITKNIFNRYLAVALTCLFTSAAVWAAPGDVISFNFHQDDSGNKGPLVGDQVTLEGTIPADNWNSNKKNIASGNWQNGSSSKTLVYNVNSNVGSECEATCAWTFNAAHFYGGAAANYSDENYFMKCIAAPQAGGSGTETLTISNIPFSKYYAVIYISNWDIGHNTSFNLGETNYSVSATGLAIPDSTADWGGTATSPVYGTNAVKIDNLSGDFSFSMTAAKCNVCAIQIVDDTAAKAGEEVVWSNLDSDAAKGTHFTKGNNAITLSIPESESCASGTIIAIKSVKFANKSGKTMQDTITINGQVSDTMTTDTSFAGNGDTSYNILHIYNFSTPPLVTIGEDYSIGSPGNNQLAAIQTDSSILIPGLASPWDAGYNAYCAVEGEVYTPAGYRVEMEETEITLSADAPVKAFSGINSLAMLKSKFDAGEVIAMFGGAWIDPTKAVQAFVQDTETETSLTYQFQVNDDSHLKMVIVEFTLGADGIYAKQIAQGYVSGKGEELLGQKILTSGGDYTFSSVGVANYTITSISAPAVVKAVGDDKVEVEFTPANDEDWADLILPTKAKGVETKGNMSFASRNTYKQTLGEREATVALVTDAQSGNLIYGLHAFNTAGLGPINRDIYLMMNGGTAGVLSGGEDATYNATKTVLTGNTLLNLKGDATVDYVYGAGLGGGQNVTTTGDIGIVIEDEAQVKGTLAAGWQSRHNSLPKVVGNTTVLIKNVQTYESAATLSSNKSSDQGWILGGGYHWGNYNSACQIEGNSSIVIDIDNEKTGVFAKNIAGGGYAKDNGTGDCKTTRDSSVVISAPDTVTFSKNVLGGGHATGTNKATIGGNSSVTINGGTYTGTIYAAGDNGEHTLVTGTATLTVNGGNLLGATLKGGTATGGTILNVNGGKVPLNVVSGFTTINIGEDAEICFGDGAVAGTAYPLTDCTSLTYGETSAGTLELPAADVTVGSVTMTAVVTLDFDNKTVSYAIPSDSTLTRRADFDGMTEEDYKWTASGSWINGNNQAVDWPSNGATYVNIDADSVSKVIVDTKVEANMITLTNSATEEGAEFRFETLEDLGEVAQEKENPQCVIEGKLSAAGFAGKIYLQSRITQEVTLGDETRVIFVAGLPTEALPDGNPDEETTAYSYTFKNLCHPIGKIGLGVFTVPSSMYGYQFNVEAGYIAYDSAEDFEFSTAITGAGGIIKRGTGTMTTNGNQAFTGEVIIEGGTIKVANNRSLGPADRTVTLKTGGTLDINAKDNNGLYLNLAGGTLKNSASGASTNNVMFKKMFVSADSIIDIDYDFGVINGGWNATTMELGANTITKRGEGGFVLCNVTVDGSGKINVEEGELYLHSYNSTATNMTIDMSNGASFAGNAKISVAKLIKRGGEPALNATMLERVTPSKVELADSGVIETTGGVTLSYALSENQNGTIKIINLGPEAYKIADVDFAAIPETLQIIDGEGTSVKESCYVEGGALYFGSRYASATYELNETQIGQLGEMLAGRPYTPDPTLSFSNPDVVISNLPEGYLAKNIDGTLLVFKKTNSISIKFGPRGATEGHIGELDENVGGFPVMGMFWNHSKDYAENGTGTTEIFKVKDGNDEVLTDTRVFYYCPNTYYVNSGNNHQTTGNGKLTYSYIDDSERVSGDAATTALTITQDVDGTSETRVLKPTPTGKLFWEVGISDVPYQVFDLYIYQASDQTSEPISLLPIGVKANDGEWKYFAGDGYGSTIAATDQTRWNGAAYCDSETMVEGTNYIRYRMSAAALGLAAGTTIENIYLTYPDKSNGRLGLAGIQLVEVEDDGLYTRVADPADMDGDNDERNVWTRENSWKKSNGSVINWPTEGERNVTINADEVKAIKINDVITANGVKVVNNATSYTADTKSFKFLTEEGLDTVATENANPDYILNAPVDATGFCGDLYLQSRISGMVSLGANTHITFVAMEEGEETTAYPYNFSGTINPIRKIGLGTFKVPESMFRNDIGFNVTGGNIRYAYSGTTAKTIGNVFGAGKMIKDGTGTITLSGNDNIDLEINGGTVKYHQFKPFKNNAQVVVNEGGHLDVNGKDASTGFLPITLNGGYLENNTAGTGDASLINKTWPVHQITVNKNSYIGGLAHFGLINLSHAATKIDLGENTLIKEGTNTFSLCQTTINGTGKLKVKTGSVSVRSNYASSATNATIEVDDGATFEVFNGTNFNVKNLIVNGTATTPNANAKIIVSGVLGGVGRVGKIKLEDGAILDVSNGIDCLTATSSLEFGSNLVIRGGRVGAIIMSGIPEDTILPRSVSLEGSSGVYSISRNSDGNLVLGASYITVTVPTLENASVTAVANGSTLTFGEGNTITVIAGTEVTFTYTAADGYYGSGSITVAINNESSASLIVPDPNWIKKGTAPVCVVIREYKGAKVMKITGLDSKGFAESGSTVTILTHAGEKTYTVTPNENNLYLIEVEP